MIHVLHQLDARRGLLLAGGVALGAALAGATAGVSWESAAIGLGLALAAIVGLAQTCSAWGYNAIFTIAPFVEGTQTQRRWLQRATVYAVSMTAAGAATGIAFAAAGYGLERLWADATAPLAVALGAAALLYALHELELLRLPVPGRDWQVPADWVRHGFYRSAAIFGGTVGLGVFTRVPYASLPVLLVWLFVSGNVAFGAVAGVVYGATRAFSIYSSGNVRDTQGLVGLNQRFMSLTPMLHQSTGLALAAFGAFLVVAPLLAS